MKICKNCQSEIKSRRKEICDKCYCKEWWIANRPPPKIKERSINCLDCGKERELRGRSVKYCNWCAMKRSYEKNPESYEKRKIKARNYHRKGKGLDINLPLMKAENGAGHVNKNGYRMICKLGHPNATNKKGAIGEHTFIMSEHLQRPLKKGETIHHINGNRSDNRLENLELWHKSHPPGQRLSDKIKWAKEFLEEYGYIVVEEKNSKLRNFYPCLDGSCSQCNTIETK